MRIPSVPTPTQVVGAVGTGLEQLESLASAVPRVLQLLTDAEQLVARVDAVVTAVDATREKADAVVRRTSDVVGRAEAVVADVEPTVARISALTSTLDPSLATLSPVLDRLAETTDPDEVQAVVTMIDMLPALVGKLESDIVPILDTMGTVAPDLRELLHVSGELNEMLARLPGMGRVKEKVEREQAAEEADKVAEDRGAV